MMTFSSVLGGIVLHVMDVLVPKIKSLKIIQLNYAIRLHKQHDPNHAYRVF